MAKKLIEIASEIVPTQVSLTHMSDADIEGDYRRSCANSLRRKGRLRPGRRPNRMVSAAETGKKVKSRVALICSVRRKSLWPISCILLI
jgi:hypothetical protein